MRRIVSNRFWTTIAGRRRTSSPLGIAAGLNTKTTVTESVNSKRALPLAHQALRQDFAYFLNNLPHLREGDTTAVQPDQASEQQFTLDTVKDMLKRAIQVGDYDLFRGMWEAIPASLSLQDGDLTAYFIVKLSEAKQLGGSLVADLMVDVLKRHPHHHQDFSFLCDLTIARILEESNLDALNEFLSFMQTRPEADYQIDDNLREQFIMDVYITNADFDTIRELFSQQGAAYSVECYEMTLLALVEPEPLDPKTVKWDRLAGFLSGIRRCPNLAAALENLFSIHPPPDYIVRRLIQPIAQPVVDHEV